MRGIGAIGLSLAAVLFSAQAEAQVVVPVRAEIASSSGRARDAFDADVHTAWCGAASDGEGGATVTVRFEEAVTLQDVVLYGVDDDERAPITVTLTTDAGTTATPIPSTSEGTTATVPVGPTRSLEIRLPGARTRHGRCLSEIDVHLVGRRWIYGVSAEAADALPAAITAIEDALVRCDAAALGRLARFPVRSRETELSSGRSGYERAAHPASPYRSARALPCSWAVFQPDGDASVHPMIDGGIAPGVVRVLGGEGASAVYWELAWSAAGWRLVSIDTAFFE